MAVAIVRAPPRKQRLMAETYAIIEAGGKQYRAEKGTVLVVDRMAED